MSDEFQAPYVFSVPPLGAYQFPEGEDTPFTLPVCTTTRRLKKLVSMMLNPTWHYGDLEHIVDIFEALPYINKPHLVPCYHYPTESCEDGEGCREYSPQSFILTYAPNDPFQTPNLQPDPYPYPPWYTYQGQVQGQDLPDWLTQIGAGVELGDTFVLPYTLPNVWLLGIPPIIDPLKLADLANAGFPRFRVYASGEGTAELHLLKIPFGGLALITVDDNPLSYELVNMATLNTGSFFDWQSIIEAVLGQLGSQGLQLVNRVIVEKELIGSGDHHIDITFIPYGDPTGDFGFGGGVRKVVLCGESLQGVPNFMPQFDLDQNGHLLWRPNFDTSWEDLGLVQGENGQDGLGIADVTAITLDPDDPATAILDQQSRIITFGIPQGIQGVQGLQGLQGVQGLKGDKGDQGERGLQGIQGLQGLQGIQGQKGDKGDKGDMGEQGDCPDCGGGVGSIPPNSSDPTAKNQEVCGASLKLWDWVMSKWADYYALEIAQPSQNVGSVVDLLSYVIPLGAGKAIFDAGKAIFDAGASTVNTYVSTLEFSEDGQCWLYTHIRDNNHTFTGAIWSDFVGTYSNATSNPPAFAFGQFLATLRYEDGELRYRLGLDEPSDDCSTICGGDPTWQFTVDFETGENIGRSAISNGGYVAGVGIVTSCVDAGYGRWRNRASAHIYAISGKTINLTKATVTLANPSNVTMFCGLMREGYTFIKETRQQDTTFTFEGTDAAGNWVWFDSMNPPWEAGQSSDCSTLHYVKRIVLEGTGDNPFVP